MINRIMKTGVVAVALAASALLATPASAQQGVRGDRAVSDLQLRGGPDRAFRGNRIDHNRGHGKVFLNEYGQTKQEVRYLADKAIYACACQLEIDAYKYGFKEATFRGTPHFEQIGKNRFVVKGSAKLYDGYDVSRQSYDCVVRRGDVRQASGLHPVAYRGKGFGKRPGFGRISVSFGNFW